MIVVPVADPETANEPTEAPMVPVMVTDLVNVTANVVPLLITTV